VDKGTVPWFKATAEAWLAEVGWSCYKDCHMTGTCVCDALCCCGCCVHVVGHGCMNLSAQSVLMKVLVCMLAPAFFTQLYERTNSCMWAAAAAAADW
jgi:hypothetical protein